MNKQIQGLMYFFTVDTKRTITVFWSILLSLLIISFVTMYVVTHFYGQEGVATFFISMPIYIFAAIHSFKLASNTLPFAIKMGSTRKMLFVSLGAFFLIESIVQGLLINAVTVIIDSLKSILGMGTKEFMLIHPAMWLNESWFDRMLVDTTLVFTILAVFFTFGLLFHKYGLSGGGSVLALLAFILILSIFTGWIADAYHFFVNSWGLILFGEVMLVGIAIYCLSWTLMRRFTV
ncbi:hypothetical protein QR721_02965 [Aciduricibacillus chroicocephali]|uniref:ABC transporter permease n=1 Tax=Aciduricibacillus chroicocephali TaxID=3054939 RepID=A0ABY9KZX0_9BACI|nr:hypothetical protein QR721_02965 [Bacillaceae bacterium 44XB]